ncbi:hypothetical protein F3Y22_tig00110332pilonHSYRG00942 [Hibiscus syriacus]|uniref:Uncharacterized protein n=1 Tax=Hibiscus syriacus TaxID=106335 RepID=A0A6A3B1L8_HIBSY|nr:hypothetical protein F3Y22_tig00110332pilonHSYRG00942 [Hibiscus syriacus]
MVLSLFLEQSSLMATEVIVIRKPISYELSSRDEMVHLAGYGEEKLSSVLVTGSVLCQACHHHHQLRSWPISGAMVIVKCETPCKTISYTTQATTDEYGDYIFEVDVPTGIGEETQALEAFMGQKRDPHIHRRKDNVPTYDI